MVVVVVLIFSWTVRFGSLLHPTFCSYLVSELRYNAKERMASFSCNKSRIPEAWIDWAEKTKTQFQDLLDRRKWEEEENYAISDIATAFNWTCQIVHCEHVKSYGPKTDHLVLDMKCRLS